MVITGIFTFCVSIGYFDTPDSFLHYLIDRLNTKEFFSKESVVEFYEDYPDQEWSFSIWNWIYLVLTQVLTYTWILVTIIYFYKQDKMVKTLDEQNLTDSDFTVMLTNLPIGYPKKEIRELVTRAGVKKEEIVYINLCYRYQGLAKIKSKMLKAISMQN